MERSCSPMSAKLRVRTTVALSTYRSNNSCKDRNWSSFEERELLRFSVQSCWKEEENTSKLGRLRVDHLPLNVKISKCTAVVRIATGRRMNTTRLSRPSAIAWLLRFRRWFCLGFRISCCIDLGVAGLVVPDIVAYDRPLGTTCSLGGFSCQSPT